MAGFRPHCGTFSPLSSLISSKLHIIKEAGTDGMDALKDPIANSSIYINSKDHITGRAMLEQPPASASLQTICHVIYMPFGFLAKC